MLKDKVPLKIVGPIIVVTWVLSLISSLAIVYMLPSAIQVRSDQIGDGLITSNKISSGAVTSTKLASGTVPFNSSFSGNFNSTTSANWVDMPGMSVSIKLNRTSHVVIMFSSYAYLSASGYSLDVRATVADDVSVPGSVSLTTVDSPHAGSYSYTFYKPSVGSGVRVVKVQWSVSSSGATATVGPRTLTVIALPT